MATTDGLTLADLLFAGDLEPGDAAVHADGEAITVADLRARADTVAAALVGAGVEPGRAVGVLLPTGVDLVATLFGVWRMGGVYVPLNPRLTDVELERVTNVVHAAVVITGAGDDGRVDSCPNLIIDGDGSIHVHDDAARPIRIVQDPGAALIQFTSGTTGRPKPVLLRHEGVLELLDGVIGTVKTGATATGAASERRTPMPNLIPVSLSLWAGIYQVLFAFRVGASVVLMDRFEPATFAALVREFAIRSVVLPPAAMTMLCDDDAVTDLSPLRYVRSITAPLSPLQARRFHDQFGIVVLNGYGQTEIGGEIVGWGGADAKEFGESKLGAVGRPHRGVSVRAVDGNGATLAADQPGELWVLTPALSAGYVDGGDLADRLSPDGWFRTGDIGRVDADGFVWIEGRVSDMINRGGLKVYPDEVAEVLRLSPAVADAAVIGVPDERLGEVPCAFVVATDDAALDIDELDALARIHLAPYKVPTRYEVIDELPHTEVGKLVRADLLARITND